MAQRIEEWADEQVQVRVALPAEVNNVLSAFWSGLGALALALFALLPMITYDLQKQGILDWAGEWKDWVGVLSALVLATICGLLGGVGSLRAVKQDASGLKWVKVTAITVLALGSLLGLAVLVLIIQGQFKLGPTPILAGTLLVILALLPVFLGGLTLSLATVEAVREFFYPPELAAQEPEIPAEEAAEIVEPGAVAGIDEETLKKSLGQLPTSPTTAPTATAAGEIIRAELDTEAGEVIRAELDESRLIRAELATQPGEVIRAEVDEQRLIPAELDEEALVRAELDEERIVRAELDEERLVGAEPASGAVSSAAAGPASDIFQAESAVRPPGASGEIDIERIGDTASRIWGRTTAAESPSAILLGALTAPSSPSDALGQVLQPETPVSAGPAAAPLPVEPPAADVPPHESDDSAPPVRESVGESVEVAADSSPEPAMDSGATAEEIFSAPVAATPPAETSAVDLQQLTELDMSTWQELEDRGPAEPETPVYLPSGAPEIESVASQPQTPDMVLNVEMGVQATSADQIRETVPSQTDVLFPDLTDVPVLGLSDSSKVPDESASESSWQPLPPSDELFRDVDSESMSGGAQEDVIQPEAFVAPKLSPSGSSISDVARPAEDFSLAEPAQDLNQPAPSEDTFQPGQEASQSATDTSSEGAGTDIYRIAPEPELDIRWEPEE
ncbi:MAG: hypothetical protein RMI91_02185 [Gemmatales bacterium]|nr:hypothetical protein [Gemmatales bacterium]MDW7993436.1 hypothetical protein [Gemmatales bacterium]